MEKKLSKKIIVLLCVLMIISVAGCKTSNKEDFEKDRGKKIALPYDSSYYEETERPSIDIIDELKDLGFTNIKKIEDKPGMSYHRVNSVKIYRKDSKKAEEFKKNDIAYSNDLIEVHYFGSEFEDGVIYGTDIFELEKYLKKFENITWGENYSVIKGRRGYFGTLMAIEDDVDADLYGDDRKEVQSASLTVPLEKIELLKTFAAYFDTKLINSQEVEKWLDECLVNEDYQSKVFGDAEFTLFYNFGNDSRFKLSIRACEKE